MSHLPPRLLAGFAVACLLMLATANALLWRMDRLSPETAGGASPQSAAAPSADHPRLPEPTAGSGRAVVDEFERASRRFESLLAGVRGQLAETADGTAPLGRLGPQLSRLAGGSSEVSASLRALTAATTRLGPLGEAAPMIGGVTASLDRISQPLAQLAPIETRLRAVGTRADALTGVVESLDTSTRSMHGIMRELRETLGQTNAHLERLGHCFETPVVCRRPGADGP